jgi:hypothetical protein
LSTHGYEATRQAGMTAQAKVRLRRLSKNDIRAILDFGWPVAGCSLRMWRSVNKANMVKATADINKSATRRLWFTKRLFSSLFVLYALQAGKFREAMYSIFLESHYWWCYVFRIRSRLVEFEPTPFWRCCSEYPLNLADLAATLRLRNFSVVESATKWFIITESADGMIFGATHDRPHVLQRADNLPSTPTEIFEFDKPIFCVFISSSNRILVSTKGVVYLSKNGGSHFDPVLQLSDDDSTVWHNHGIDETPRGLVIGEYANIVASGTWNYWKSVAYLYSSHDDGESWHRFDYLVRTGAKHVHLVKYSRRFGRLLVTDGDKRKQSYWVGLIDQMKPRDFKQARFDSFARGGGHTAFAETENATLLGTDYRIAANSIICVHSSEDSSARMLPRPYRHSPVLNMLCMTYRAGKITFAYLYGGLCHRCQNALIYSDDDGDSWYRLIEFDNFVHFSIANAQQGANRSLVLSFSNTKLGENRTFIVSPI